MPAQVATLEDLAPLLKRLEALEAIALSKSEPEFIETSEAMRRIGVKSRATFARLLKQNGVNARLAGKKRVFRVADLDMIVK